LLSLTEILVQYLGLFAVRMNALPQMEWEELAVRARFCYNKEPKAPRLAKRVNSRMKFMMVTEGSEEGRGKSSL